MADRPRLTGSLRAFSGVSSPTELRTSDAELTEELILKRKWKNSQNTLSWTDLKNIVQERCQPKDKSKVYFSILLLYSRFTSKGWTWHTLNDPKILCH